MVSHLIGLGDLNKSVEENVGRNEVYIEIKFLQHVQLHSYNVVFVVSVVAHVDVVLDKGRPDLLVLASNKHC